MAHVFHLVMGEATDNCGSGMSCDSGKNMSENGRNRITGGTLCFGTCRVTRPGGCSL